MSSPRDQQAPAKAASGWADALLSASPLPSAAFDLEGVCMQANRAWLAAGGARAGERAKQGWAGPALDSLVAGAKAPGFSGDEAEVAGVGEQRWRLRAFPLHQGSTLLGVGVVALPGEAGARSEAGQDEFLAVLSHELRTPLTAVAGWASILLGGRADNPVMIRRGLEVIDRCVRAQTRIIDDLLDVSRIITGKLKLDRSPVSLWSTVAEAAQAVDSMAQGKGVSIELRHDGSGLGVEGDAERLRQVVWNLLSNAVKFSPTGSRVEVWGRREGAWVVVSVKDAGRGIEPSFLPHVFERFRQADSSMTRTHGGLGLGLAIVRHLVEMHGGRVIAESEGQGKGANFTVSLPAREVAQDRPTTPLSTPTPSHEPTLEGLSLLVLEDDDDARELVARLLEAAGAKVVTAPSADEAVAELSARAIDLAVSDIAMPERDGYWFLEQAARIKPGMPVIGLSAYAAREDAAHALEAGFSAYLTKPIDVGELIATIARLGKHR